MKKVFILCASDRFNYGDLLFPIITKKELEKYGNFEIHNVSTTKSDLTSAGALKTESYRTLYQDYTCPKPTLIVAGGEVLGAGWSVLYSFIYKWFYHVRLRTKNKERLELIVQKLLRQSQNPMPFVPISDKIVENYKIVYHGVGGDGIGSSKFKERLKSVFPNSKYLSVRDNETYKDINLNYPKCNLTLTQDCALLMSDYFTFSKTKSKYIAFQVGHTKHESKLNEINLSLQKLYEQTGMPVKFVSIGNCPGHDDIKSLRWLLKEAKYPCSIAKHDTIYQIMEDIACSEMFIGTSLHGIITAFSFGVPFVPLNPRHLKIQNYLNTWFQYPFNCMTEFENIHIDAIAAFDRDWTLLKSILLEQKEIVRNSFKKISQIIELE